MSVRSDRMVSQAPQYYQFSRIYEQIQTAQGDEYDSLEAKNEDLRDQLYIVSATWGLKYWEIPLKIPVVESDGYEIRRSRVLSRWRGIASQFSAKLIKNVCQAFSGGEVEVTLDHATYTITITFVGTAGTPPNINDLKYAVENIVHAHMGTVYEFMYTTWDDLDAQAMTFDTLDTYTWDAIEVAFAI
ncbi:MAG: YmfQ family protein [Desulfosporosinus sp.]|nr:YmfQ family protein [Desulfosporosinus sp.]